MTQYNITQLLTEAVTRHQNRDFAIVTNPDDITQITEKLSYQDFLDKVKAQTNLLKQYKIITICLGNTLEFAVNFFAVTCLGKTAVLIDSKIKTKDILSQIQDSMSDCIITDEKMRQLLVESFQKQQLSAPDFITQLNSANNNIDISLESPSSDTLAVIIYSSGTTGKPKGICLSHHALIESAIYNTKRIQPIENETHIPVIPFCHISGIITQLLGPLRIGAKLIFFGMLRPDKLMQSIKHYQVNFLATPPVFYQFFYKKIMQNITKQPKRKKIIILSMHKILETFAQIAPKLAIPLARKLFKQLHTQIGSSLFTLCSGGARLNAKIAKGLTGLGYDVRTAYGLTESAGPVAINAAYQLKANAQGQINDNIQIKINNPNHNGHGEIWIKSNQNMLGYYQQPKLTAETINNGWLKTGDIGYIDHDNYLYVSGRIKELILSSDGKNVYPDDIEDNFLNIAGIEELCAFGIPKQNDQIIALAVKPEIKDCTDDMKKKLENVIMEKNRDLPPHARVQKIFFHNNEFPKSASRKIKRLALTQEYKNKINF